jgi:hypothetical protein
MVTHYVSHRAGILHRMPNEWYVALAANAQRGKIASSSTDHRRSHLLPPAHAAERASEWPRYDPLFIRPEFAAQRLHDLRVYVEQVHRQHGRRFRKNQT